MPARGARATTRVAPTRVAQSTQMFQEQCRVLEHKKVAPGHFILKLSSSQISQSARPGQFVQILCDDSLEPLLPRPFSFLDVDKKSFSILYHVVGKGTAILAKKAKGDTLSVLGPCGNGFEFEKNGKCLSADALVAEKIENGSGKEKKIILVGGGVGIPPLYHAAKELIQNKFPKKNIHIFLGARDKSLLLCEREFRALGVHLHLSTDNGSKGHRGFITDLLSNRLSSILPASKASVGRHPLSSILFTCGPTPMMKAVAGIAQQFSIPCQVSVEVPMACGFGACLGCAVTVKDRDTHRYAIACCEGPVFRGEELLWD